MCVREGIQRIDAQEPRYKIHELKKKFEYFPVLYSSASRKFSLCKKTR